MSNRRFATPRPSCISQYTRKSCDVSEDSVGIEAMCVIDTRRLISLPSLDPHRKLSRNARFHRPFIMESLVSLGETTDQLLATCANISESGSNVEGMVNFGSHITSFHSETVGQT